MTMSFKYLGVSLWNNNANNCEVGNKDWNNAYNTNNNQGFRIVRSSSSSAINMICQFCGTGLFL